MGRVRERQTELLRQTLAARKATEGIQHRSYRMYPGSNAKAVEDSIGVRWRGAPPVVLAFLFVQPDADALRTLDSHGEYFDIRTGDTWDLFFPGYYRSHKGDGFEHDTNSRPVGSSFARDLYFNPRDFNALRAHIENESGQRWVFSGGTDLVLVGGWIPDSGEPTIDWESTFSRQLTDPSAQGESLTLGAVIERVTRDLETATEDASYGVGSVVNTRSGNSRVVIQEAITNAIVGIAVALVDRGLKP